MAKQSTVITDGTTEIELVYDATAQANWRLQFGERVEGGAPMPRWHMPEGFPPELTDLTAQNGEARFRLNVRQNDDIDTVLNKITELSRLIDGENQQAARYWLHGDVDRVVLKVQRKNATNATIWPIIFGEIDDGGAHYTEMADLREWAEGVVIRLFLAPYGERTNPITLYNDLPSSPHFIEDSNGDGLADGWNTFGSPTKGLSTSVYLIGGQSQFFETAPAVTSGINSNVVAAPIGSNIGCFVWLSIATDNSDTFWIRLQDGSSGLIQQKTISSADTSAADKTVESTGRTWYRIFLSGQNSSASGAVLVVRMDSSEVTKINRIYIDGTYLHVGTITIPDIWASSDAIDNRYDPTDANPGRINYIDVWGVPGDAPALVDIELDWTAIAGASKSFVYAGRVTDGKILAANITGWIDSNQFSDNGVAGGMLSEPTGTSNNHYWRLTESGGLDASAALQATLSGDAARRLLFKPLRAFGICRSSNSTDARFSLRVGVTGSQFSSGTLALDSDNDWEILDFGLINLSGFAPTVVPDTSEPDDINVDIEISGLPESGADTADFDALLLLPVEEFIVIATSLGFSTSDELVIYGHHQYVVHSAQGYIVKNVLGSLWQLEPGNVMNRLRFAIATVGHNFDLTDAANVTLTVTPRTRHLLGTK